MFIDYVRNILKIDLFTRVTTSDVMLYCHDNDRGILVNGKRYSQLIDTVGEIYASQGCSTLTIAAPFSNISSNKVFGNVISINGSISRSKALDILFSNGNKFQISFWESLLERVSPKVIIGIQPPREFCAAARNKKILIVDLQHGVISSERYYGLSYRESMSQYGWPNIVMCWNDASANYLKERVGGFTTTKVIGNPWHLKLNENQYSIFHEEAAHSQSNLNSHRVILVSLQWGEERLNENFIHPALIHYIKTRGRGYEWRLRIHPSQQNNKHILNRLKSEFQGMKNVDWVKSSSAPLPILLQEISLHITRSSATTIEASLYGIKTAILDSRTDLMQEWFFSQLKDGSAEIINPSVEKISDWVESSLNQVENIKFSPEFKFSDFEEYLGGLIRHDIGP